MEDPREDFRGRSALESWLWACGAAAVYYALARVGWPASGFAVAAGALWGPAAAAGVFLGAFLADQRPPAASALAAALAAAQALLGAALLRRPWARGRPGPPPGAELLILMIESVREYAIFRLDPAGRVSGWSRGAELIFGRAPEETLGRPYGLLLASADEGRAQLEEASRGGRFQGEGWCVRKDAGRFWGDIVLTSMRAESGALLGFAAIVRDATKRRAGAQLLEKRAADLGRSNLELSQFAYVASHDLSAPLHKVKAFAERLKDKVESGLDDEGRDYLRRMLRAVDGMQSLIDALLELARVSTRGAAAEEVDLRALAKDVVESLEHMNPRGRAAVEIGDLPRIHADPLQMRQLLQNLVSNALKFHKPGAAPKVSIRGRAVGDGRCELVVADDGIGFDMKFAERIFQPFQRLQAPYEYEGTGMGLAICRKIAERHGGTIAASGAPGRGAEFKVVLPISQEGRMECQPQEKACS
ncbi:MAG: ATP-binding protein [Elusimicrobiota bacterium]|nr:ATP-binding protein [Elusimicrobiota bacterium]